MSEQVQEVVYTGHLPFSEMVDPEVPWKIGDRVVSKYDGAAGVIVNVENFEDDQNVCVVFDDLPDIAAWVSDFEVRSGA